MNQHTSLAFRGSGLAFALLVSVLAAGAPANADTLFATPNPCFVMPGFVNCTVALSWSADDPETDLYSVNLANGTTKLVDGNPSGELSINWINMGGFRFELRNGTTVTESLEVRGEAATGSVFADPNLCLLASGASLCTSTMSWSTNVPDGMLHSVNLENGNDRLVGPASSGSVQVDWIREHGFRFEVRSGSTVLASTVVSGVPSTASVEASPNPCQVPLGALSCASQLTWSSNDLDAALYSVDLATGADQLVSGSSSGSLEAGGISVQGLRFEVRAGGLVLASVEVFGEQVSASLDAVPTPCVIPVGSLTCQTTLTWSSSDPEASLFSVNLESQVTQEIDAAASGTLEIPWIREHGFRFEVRSGGEILASLTVAGVTGSISASPEHCVVPPLTGSCQVLVAWTGAGGELWEVLGGAENLVASLPGDVSYEVAEPATLEVRIDGVVVARQEVSSRPALMGPYRVGVDYHSFGSDFTGTYIIPQLELGEPPASTARAGGQAVEKRRRGRGRKSEVRETVRGQLDEMVDQGYEVISTRLYIGRRVDTGDQHDWMLHFPPTPTEIEQVVAFAKMVNETRGKNGETFMLDLGFGWLAAADYTQGNLEGDGSLGTRGLTEDEFSQRVEQTYQSVLGALAEAGVSVRRFYFDIESLFQPCHEKDPLPGAGCKGLIGGQERENENWFAKTHYPGFFAKVSESGFEPSVYLLMAIGEGISFESVVFNDGYVDSDFPALNGHNSMFWPYRSLLFMRESGLPLPKRFELSLYTDTMDSGKYLRLVDRILDDAQAILPEFGIHEIGVVETYHFGDQELQKILCQALALQASELRNFRLDRVDIWTTKYSEERVDFGAKPVGVPKKSVSKFCIP